MKKTVFFNKIVKFSVMCFYCEKILPTLLADDLIIGIKSIMKNKEIYLFYSHDQQVRRKAFYFKQNVAFNLMKQKIN